MNLSTVGPTPALASISAILFGSNPEFPAAFNAPWLFDATDNRGGVRQDPPSDSFVIRRDAGLEPDPVATGDTDDDPTPVDEED